jgi:hypothetical protein
MALGEEESRPPTKIRPGCAKSSLGVSPSRNPNINTKNLTAVMHIHHISLYGPNHIGGNKPHRSFCAIDIRLGYQASRCANISQNQRAIFSYQVPETKAIHR